MKLFGNSKSSHSRAAGRKASQREEATQPAQEKKKKKHRGLWVALCTILVLALGIWVFLSQYIRPPQKPNPQSSLPPSVTADPNEEDPQATVDPGVEPTIQHDGQMKEDFYTILLMGTDEEDYNADVIMVAGVDVKNKSVNVVSIPRDTMVNVSRSNKKINCSYGVGKSQTGERADGAKNLKEIAATVLGFEPDFYCQVTYTGFMNAVDAVGGIEYDVPQDIQKLDTVPPIDLKKGKQTLDGEHALMLVRYRGYDNYDLGRIEAAQGFLSAAVSQIMSLDNLWNLPQLVSIAMENCSSDLDLGEMTWFGTQLFNMDKENLKFYTIPVTNGMYKGAAYVYADEAGTLELINQTVNPYKRDLTSSDVDIIRLED